MLKELRMPTMKDMWRPFADRAQREGWSHDRYLAQLAEQELADRARRRFERHRAEAKLPPGKSLDNFDFGRLPGLSERLVRVLANGGDWIDDGHNVVVLGPPGTGKSHAGGRRGRPPRRGRSAAGESGVPAVSAHWGFRIRACRAGRAKTKGRSSGRSATSAAASSTVGSSSPTTI